MGARGSLTAGYRWPGVLARSPVGEASREKGTNIGDYDSVASLPGIIHGLQSRIATLERSAGFHRRPQCRIQTGGGHSVPNNTLTTVDFTSTGFAYPESMADLAGNRIVAPAPGLYVAFAKLAWASNATGFRLAQLQLTPDDANDTRPAVSGIGTLAAVTLPARMAEGETAQLKVQQTSGGDLGVGCSLILFWVGP